MLGVFLLFLLPVGGGIPAEVLLARSHGLSWGLTAVFRLWPGAMGWTDPVLMIAGCAILLRFALWLDRAREQAMPPRPAAVVGTAG